MYSFSLTNVHSLHPIPPTEPKLVVKCKCNRRLYQQQIYTCLICPSYCCHYCSQIEFVELQCRSCKKQYDLSNKTNRCSFCFNCIQCSNVLSLAKDPQTKNYIFMCQFCFWSTKDIKLVEEKLQVLLEKLNKYSTSIKDSELRIYNYAYSFFKQANISLELENQAAKANCKRPLMSYIDQESLITKSKTDKSQKTIETMLKRTSLDEPSQQFHIEFKYPQGLPLIAKKTRKCPDCKKPLTTVFRSRTDEKSKLANDSKARHGEQKIELMHKDIQILLCQYTPLTSSKAKVKLLKDARIEGQDYKKDEIVEIDANAEFQVSIKIENRMRNTVAQATYVFIVEGPILKPSTVK